MEEIRFNSTYHFADLVESFIYGESGFWNYDEDIFIERSLSFNKETLLHHYIETKIWSYYDREFRKNGGIYEDSEDFLEFFKDLFDTYDVSIAFFDEVVDVEETEDLHAEFLDWWYDKEDEFSALFNKIADDVFYILFGKGSCCCALMSLLR